MAWWAIFSQTQGYFGSIFIIMAVVGNFNLSYFLQLTCEFLDFESERGSSVCWPNNKIIDKKTRLSTAAFTWKTTWSSVFYFSQYPQQNSVTLRKTTTKFANWTMDIALDSSNWWGRDEQPDDIGGEYFDSFVKAS